MCICVYDCECVSEFVSSMADFISSEQKEIKPHPLKIHHSCAHVHTVSMEMTLELRENGQFNFRQIKILQLESQYLWVLYC